MKSFIVTFWVTAAPPSIISVSVYLSRFYDLNLYYYESNFCHRLGDCGSSELYLDACLFVCLSRFYGLYLNYNGSDFDET